MVAELRRQANVEELARSLLDIACGRLPPGINADSAVKIKDRVAALELIFNRLEGKPLQSIQSSTISVTAALPPGWMALSPAEKKQALVQMRAGLLPSGGGE